MVPVVLLAATFLVAGCGSQQASPLSVAKTEQVFAAAGIHLRTPGHVQSVDHVHFFGTDEVKGSGLSPVAWLIGGSRHPNFFPLVSVYRSVPDAVHATRLPTNPSLTVMRVQNVVLYAPRGEQARRLRAAIRHL